MKNACLALADFAVTLQRPDIPDDVIQKEQDHLLDGLGNGLEGSASDFGRMVIDYVRENPGLPQVPLWGTPYRVSTQQAAFANSSFSNYGELEDAHFRTKFKPNTVLTPAALAMAEATGASGREMLTSLIAANEICLRVATATASGTAGYARGWIGTSCIGAIGTAVIAGRMLGLDVDQMAHAISLAGGQPCGIWSGGMAMAKRVHIGRASENGISAALMAKHGITGGTALFDGDWGTLGDIIAGKYDAEFILKDLRSMWMTREIGLENYPTKGGAHSGIDCVLHLLKEGPLPPEDIESILVRATSGIAGNKALRIFPPADFYEAQNSMPYILAVTIIDGECTMNQFTDEKIRDPRILELAGKVSIIADPEADRLAPKTKTTFVDVTLKGGRTVTHRVDYCKGEPENPLSREELNAKFRRAGSHALPEKNLSSIIEAVSALDASEPVNRLAGLLAR